MTSGTNTDTQVRIRDALEETGTSWNELKTAGKTVLEASSTTYATNTRFGLFENGEWVTPDRFDELVTQVPPLYELTIPDGDTYIITGKDRNPYLPGSDYTAGFASRFLDTGAPGDYLPAGVTATQGLVDLGNGDDEGVAVEFSQSDVQFGTYQDGTLENVQSLAANEWEANPFTSDEFDYDLSKFAVKRLEGNLYGAGSQNLFFKLRDTDGIESYLKVAETGDPSGPVIDTFSLYNQLRVANDSGSAKTVQIGPLNYYNETASSAPTRVRKGVQHGVNVTATLEDTTGTVIAVFRKDPSNVEPPITIRVAAAAETGGRIEIREVHPDYLDFGTIDETVDANWAAPAGLRQRETALQSLDMTPGDVTLSSDAEGARGEQSSVVEYDGTPESGPNPARSDQRTADESATVNQNNYFVATARHEDTAVDIERFEPITEEVW